MSEKHLTESGWKALVAKQKLKDPGVGKALAALAKCGTADFEARERALEALEKEAVTFKKDAAVKANDEAGDYLADVIAEVGKNRKALAAERKAAESEEGDEEESGANPGAIKKKMISLMGQVKTKAPEDQPLGFLALVAKGASGVVLGRTIGGAQKQMLLQMLPEAQGAKFLRGVCRFEENIHTFIMEKVPAGFSKKLQRALLAETGVKYRVRVRSEDGEFVADAETEQEPAEESAEDAGAADPQAEWLQLKALLVPEVKAALAARPELKDAVMKGLAAVLQREKAGEFAEALAQGTELRASLHPATAAAPPAAGVTLPALQAAMAKVLPKVKDAIAAAPERKNELLQPLAAVQAQMKAGNADAAMEQLRRVIALLGQAPALAAALTPAQALAGWQAARGEVVTSLKALIGAISGLGDPEGDEAIILLRAVSANLTEKPVSAQQVAELERYLTTDEIIQEAESPNGLGITILIRTPLLAALKKIKASLPLAA